MIQYLQSTLEELNWDTWIADALTSSSNLITTYITAEQYAGLYVHTTQDYICVLCSGAAAAHVSDIQMYF